MKAFLLALRWEIILDFKEYARYRIGLLMDFIVFTGTFIIIYYLGISEGFATFYNTNENTGRVLVLIGYIFWQNASSALGYSQGMISSEAGQGVLELRLQSLYPVEIILFFRLLTSIFIHLVTYIGIIAFVAAVSGLNGKDISIIILSIIVSIPSLVGMYGMGLILGGICICEKSIGSLVRIVQTILLFATNTLSPSRGYLIFLIPFTGGIEIMRSLYMGLEVSYIMIGSYLIINLFWGGIGLFIFRKALNYERKYGSFDNY